MLCSDFWVKRVQMEGQCDSIDHGDGKKKKERKKIWAFVQTN